MSLEEQLLSSEHILVLTGPGLSAGSGLTPFTRNVHRTTWHGIPMADLATPEAFEVDPQLVWRFYAEQRATALEAGPNRAHKCLARLTAMWGADRVLTLTSNQDALHEMAGHPQEALVHMHGELFLVRCTDRRCQYSVRNFDPQLGARSSPECPRCGANLRPGVTWFGEPVPYMSILTANTAIERGVDLVLCVGMSADTYPAAGYIDEVRDRGGRVAIFNTTAIDADWNFQGRAEDTLPEVLENVVGQIPKSESSSDLSELSANEVSA